jgi:hypothetical protein
MNCRNISAHKGFIFAHKQASQVAALQRLELLAHMLFGYAS